MIKKGQIELEFRWGEYVAPLAFVVASIIGVIITGIINHWSSRYDYVFYFCPASMYVFAFAIAAGVNLMPKMREPTMTNYHLLFVAFGLGIFFFSVFEFVLNKISASVQTPAFHQLFFGLLIFWTCLDEFLFGGLCCACLKSKIVKFILNLILTCVLCIAFHLFVFGAALNNTIDFTIGFLPTYFSWLSFAGFMIYYPFRDVFAESPFLVRMGAPGRGVCYLLISLVIPICPIAIIFGLTFLTEVSFDVMPLPNRFAAAFIPSLFGWSALIVMQKYSDNFTLDHPVQPVDLNQGKKGGRKGLSKNQKPSESGIRCWKRLGVTIGSIIVGYYAAHWILIPMRICGNLYISDFPQNSYAILEETVSLTPLLSPDYEVIMKDYKEKDFETWAKHHQSPVYNPTLWGYGYGGEAGIAMTVAVILCAHGIYTMAYGLQVPKSGQTIRHTAYEEEVEPTEGEEEDEEAKEAAKAAAEEAAKQDKKLSAKSGYGNVKKK